MNFEVTELLKFRMEKINEVDTTERENLSLGLFLSVCRDQRNCDQELRLGGEDNVLSTNL